jgi:putative membrane protein
MMRVAALFGLLGLIAATGLFLWQGVGSVLQIFATAGFGILWVAIAHFIPMGLNARAWQIIVPRMRPSVGFFLWAVWLREAVNGLLPVGRIGGEVVTAQLLMRRGLSPALAVGSLIIDVTLCLGSQLVFTLAGLALLIMQSYHSQVVRDLIVAMVIALPLIILFFFAQKYGLFTLMATIASRLFGDRFAALSVNAISIDRKVKRLYCRRMALLSCGLWQLAGFAAGALEIWLALFVLNHPFSLLDSLILESLIQALSSSAFIVPAALGVQEGGFVLIGGLLGLAPETALALALMRRARDIIVFAPALVVWQLSWGKRLLLTQHGSRPAS